MLLLPRRIFQDTRLQFSSTSTTTTTIVLSGGTPVATGRVISNVLWFVLRRRRSFPLPAPRRRKGLT